MVEKFAEDVLLCSPDDVRPLTDKYFTDYIFSQPVGYVDDGKKEAEEECSN